MSFAAFIFVWDEKDYFFHDLVHEFSACFVYFFVAVLHYYEYFRSYVGSTPLLFFWLLNSFLNIMLLKSQVSLSAPSFMIAVRSIDLAVSLIMLYLENRSKECPEYSLISDQDFLCETASPEVKANIFSRLIFQWMDPLMKLGYRKNLDMDDLWGLRKLDSAQVNSSRFGNIWQEETLKKKPLLINALFKAYGYLFISAAIFKALQDILSFVQPTLLKAMMQFTASWSKENKGHEQPLPNGIAIAFLMLFAAISQTLFLHQYFHMCIIVGMRVKAAIITAVYQKALRLSSNARQSSTVGEIVNLMSVDAGRISDLTTYFHIVWSGPFQIIMALYFLHQTLGPAIYAGVAVMLLMIPVNALIATWARALNKIQMANKDKRTKLMDEVLSGMKVIKLYAWEIPFIKRIQNVRELELSTLKRIGYLAAGQTFTWACTPLLVSFVSFALFTYISDEKLTSDKVFVAMSLFNLLQFPLAMFPAVISAIVDASVSFSRLYKFLMNEELDPLAVTYEDISTDSASNERVVINDASFRWSKDSNDNILSNITINVEDGKLLAIVGAVGAGKSSLLSAILGEMYKISGSVTVSGKLAYVSQTPWIMNATLRENITFGLQFDVDFYNEVIYACGLKPDLEILPGGDLTEIGERGINVSGGQKQRISLARAVYARADIYLLDDTLSAVDAHVGRHIFDNVIGPSGLLSSKARVFVTHGIHMLPETDFIILLKDGRILETGKYSKLMSDSNSSSELFALMNEYSKPNEGQSAVSKAENSATDTPDAKTSKDDSDKPNPKIVALTTTEESAKGSVSWSVYSTYANSCGINYIILFVVVALISQFLSIYQNIYLSNWADANDRQEAMVVRGFLKDNVSFLREENVFQRLLVYGALGLGYAAAVVVQVIVVWIYCGIQSARTLHDGMIETVMKLPQSYFDTTPLGRILNRFSKDVYTVDEVLPRTFQGYFRTLLIVIAVIAVNTYGNWMYIVFVSPLIFLYMYFQRYYLTTSRELKRLDSTSRSPVYAHFQETLGGVSTIRAYNQSPRFICTNEDRVDYNMRAYYPSVASNRWLAIRLEFIGSLIVFGSAMFAVVSIAVNGHVKASLVGLAITYSLSVTQTLNWMVRQSCEIETNIVSVERMKEYIDLKREAPYEIPETAPSDEWPEDGSIEFKDYSVRYREDLDYVLKQISFSINKHEKIGIVGRTGAGKSSLTLALFRIIEAATGSVFIDGVDVSKIGLFNLRSKMTIIPQDAFVFTGTLRENLQPYDECTDAQLWEALEAANMKEAVSKMEGKLDAAVQQGGENFSVGQRQLLCLARAVLRKSKILVLDEATAAIDYETDSIIQSTIRKLANDCTVITIAHRIKTIIDYDRILVLDMGKVAEFDAPDVLLRDKKSKFYSLAKEAGLV